MKTPKAVLWDMDGTLIDSEHIHHASIMAALAKLSITLPKDFFHQVYGRSDSVVYDLLSNNHSLELSYQQWLEIRLQEFLARITEIKPRKGAMDLWHKLKEQGIKTAVVSNSLRVVLDASLGQVGLLSDDLVTVSVNDVSKAKPNPEPYLRAAKMLECQQHEVIVIEDSTNGALAGLSAGMVTYMIPPDGQNIPDQAPPPDAKVIGSLEQLGRLF